MLSIPLSQWNWILNGSWTVLQNLNYKNHTLLKSVSFYTDTKYKYFCLYRNYKLSSHQNTVILDWYYLSIFSKDYFCVDSKFLLQDFFCFLGFSWFFLHLWFWCILYKRKLRVLMGFFLVRVAASNFLKKQLDVLKYNSKTWVISSKNLLADLLIKVF